MLTNDWLVISIALNLFKNKYFILRTALYPDGLDFHFGTPANVMAGENNGGKQSNALFVNGLASSTTASHLEELFSGVGPLRRCFVVTMNDSKKRCSGSGFVHYALLEDACKALSSLQGATLCGRKIKIDFARKRERSGEAVDDDGGLRKKRPRSIPQPSKNDNAQASKKSMYGSVASRTVLVQSRVAGQQLDLSAVLETLGDDPSAKGFESAVGNNDSTCLRLLFRSWPQAGSAASKIHSADFDACVDALRGGRKCKLIVRNLPFMVCVKEIRQLFEKVARVREITLPTRKKGSEEQQTALYSFPSEDENGKVKCSGFGFVEYFLAADANRAVKALNEEKIGGRMIAVDLAIGKSAFVQKNIPQYGNKAAVEEEGEEEASISNDDENEQTVEPVKKAQSTEDEMKRTVFIRNLSFETTSQELWCAFEKRFGTIEQAVIVRDRVTGRPRGTAFVRFCNTDQVAKAIEVNPNAVDSEKKKAPNSAGRFSLQGRDLYIVQAATRKQVKAATEGSGKEESVKERSARLAKVGFVNPNSEEARALSEADLEKRAKAEKEKNTKLCSNPNAFVSDKRVIVRNMPKFVDEKFLKQMCLIAARQGDEGAKKKSDIRITHCKIVRNSTRNDISRGFGFVLFEEHEHALAALKFLNNNTSVLDTLIKARPRALQLDAAKIEYYRREWTRSRRLLCEFSVEDSRQVAILDKVKAQGKKARMEAQKEKEGETKNARNEKPSNSKKRKTRTDQQVDSGKSKSQEESRKDSSKRRRRKKAEARTTDEFDGIVERYCKKLKQ